MGSLADEAGEEHEIAAALRGLGVSDEIIERALARGDPIAAVFEQVLLPARDELLATRQVVEDSAERFEWERAGAIRVRGVAGLVELFRLKARAS